MCGDLDWQNSLIFVNGYKRNQNYVLKENDIACVRVFPSAVSSTALAYIVLGFLALNTIAEGVSYALTGKSWEKNLYDYVTSDDTSVTNTADTSETQNLPSISGATNAKGNGKTVPLVIGKSLFSPFVCGNSYTTISGTDGEEQYYHALYVLGYAPLKVSDIYLDNLLMSTNPNDVISGIIPTADMDGAPRFSGDNVAQIEIQGEGGEVSLYQQKVVQENYGTQIIHTTANESTGTKDYILKLDKFSARNPQRIEVEIAFDKLFQYDDSGAIVSNATPVKIGVAISFDSGSTWSPFGQFAQSDSYTTQSIVLDSEDTDISGTIGVSWFTRAKNKNLRFVASRTMSYSEAVNANNRVAEIRVVRINEESTDSKICDTCTLQSIRTWCYDYTASVAQGSLVAQVPVIAKKRNITVRMGLNIKATSAINSSLDSLNCILETKCRTWDGSEWSKRSSKKTATDNPASVALATMQSVMLGDRAYPDSKIDLEALGELYEFCENQTYVDESGASKSIRFTCGGVLTSQKKLSDVIDTIFSTCRSAKCLNGGKYSVIIDKPRSTPVTILNNHNILNSGLSNEKKFDVLPDGYTVKFVDQTNDYNEGEIHVMYDKSKVSYEDSTNMESIEMTWQTNPYQVYMNTRYLEAKRKLRPETWTRKVGIDGNIIEVGNLVEIQDDTIVVGMGSGVVKGVSFNTNGDISSIQTDSFFNVSDTTKSYALKVNTENGIGLYPVTISVAGLYNVLTFTTAIDIDETTKPCVGDIISFGISGKITTDVICLAKKENDDQTFDMSYVPYDEGVYTADKEAIPEYDPKMTPAQAIISVLPVNPNYVTKTEVSEAVLSSPSIELSSESQIIAKSADGTVTPSSSFTVTATVKNTTITAWTYSVDGGTFSSTLPTGVTRTDNVVSINPATVTFKTLGINASDGTISDTMTIAKVEDGATGAKGDTGAKGADGTDSTAITISAPSSTTPESGMKYDKTYYGIYSGVWYKWSWSSTTTGAWTQVSADTPPTPTVRYSFDEMPDLPDDSGATYKKDADFTTTSPWTASKSNLSIVSGELVSTPTTTHNEAQLISSTLFNGANSGGKIVKIKVYSPVVTKLYLVSLTNYVVYKSFSLVVGYNIISFIFPTDSYNYYLSAVTGSNSLSLRYNQIYIGDGPTSQPIIDNISGEHNATGSGVVSVAGVSGKACQFVGSSHFVAKSPSITTSMSFNFWFTPDNVTDAMTLLQNRNTTGFGISIFLTGGQIMFDFGGSRDTFGFSFVAGNIYHIGVDVNTTNKKLYINGELKQSINYTYADHSSYLTDYIWSGLSSLNGTSFAGNATKGIIDDLQIFNRELSASEHIGLYLDRGARAKLYTLADYNYESQVSSWEIVSSVPSFTRARSGAVTPSSVTFSAKAVIASAAQDYTGRFKIYLNGSSSAFYTSSSDESSHAYAIPSGTTSMKIELYKAGSTTALVATKEFAVPYAADVAPEYLGIGLLADVSGLTTKAYTSATITDAGVITPGSPVSAVIPGDWMINYTAGTYRALGIYYWSGSAWTITSDSKYTSDGVIEDICRLNNGGILIPDWTVYVNLIADNLFSHKIKLTTKTISGVTYEGVFYGGERFNADGSVADRSKNGFYFKTDGKGWCNLQSDDLYNTIIGTEAGLQLISGPGYLGRYNSIYGDHAGYNLTDGLSSSVFGAFAGYNLTDGKYNSVFGAFAGYSLTTGYENSVFGNHAGYSLTTGYKNSVFGYFAGESLTTGYENSVFGNHAGYSLTTGKYNCLLGNLADVYTGAWNYQINLNNRIIYLEFASVATQDTVYKAITHYLTTVGWETGGMGMFNHYRIDSIRYSTSSLIEFCFGTGVVQLQCTSGSLTKIGYPLQVAFIMPAEPTNK